MSSKPFAAIALVIDKFKVVINKGSKNGIKEGDRFLIYELTKDIVDPETNISLGPLEMSKGTGVAANVQETMTIVESDMFGGSEFGLDAPQEPFENPKVNDKAKPI